MSMRAAESRTLTAGSAFNEPVWATVLLDRRLSQATMIGIKGEGCRPGEQTHAVLLGRRTFAAPPADEGRQLKAGPLSMSHRTLWICPSRGRPLSVAPTPEVGEAGAHRPLEISRAIVAAHACVGTARFPQLHSASSSSITRDETDDEGVISEPEYTLTKPSSGPNHRDHLRRSVQEALTLEKQHLRAMPAHPPATCRVVARVADKFGHVRVDTVTYSVPIRYAYRPVWAKLYHDRVAIAVGAEVVAQHGRAFCRGTKVLDAFHVLPLLERKHRAVAEATALVGWRLAPVWQQVRAELAKHTRKPDQEWVRMLRLMETHPAAAVERAVATALERQSPRLETVRLILRQQQAGPPPVCLPVAGVRPELARITVAAPTLAAYDALVEGPC